VLRPAELTRVTTPRACPILAGKGAVAVAAVIVTVAIVATGKPRVFQVSSAVPTGPLITMTHPSTELEVIRVAPIL